MRKLTRLILKNACIKPEFNKPKLFFLILLFIVSCCVPLRAQSFDPLIHSDLWGVEGELWDQNGRLRNFTNVGYKGGEPIPDWPVAHSVTDYGAIPNDGIDDSAAFIAAIEACPDEYAVLVPRGQFTIMQIIRPDNDNFVLRGEDMYESIIFLPKYYGEVYINEIGFQDPSDPSDTRSPIYSAFFQMANGVGKSLENLTFKFREQRKLGVWEYEGNNIISYEGTIKDSWVRNCVFLNYDSALDISSDYCSFINLVFDQFNGRTGTDSGGGALLDAYGSILPRNCNYNLFHNIHIEGTILQPIDMNETSTNNVYSQYRGGELINRSASYHGGRSNYCLYTDLNKGVVTPNPGSSRSNETYWNVDEAEFSPAEVNEDAYNATNSLIFVGYGDSFPAKEDDPDLWYEPANFGQITPKNLYLAQLEYFGKPLPEDFPVPAPAPYEEDVIRVLPVDDIKEGNWYYKFDLSDADFPAVAHARLRVHFESISTPPYRLRAWMVTDDSWTEDSITPENRPTLISMLDSIWYEETQDNRVLEFDVTPFVRDELVGGDGIVTLALDITDGPINSPRFWTFEKGTKPELIVERTESSKPGPPSAPKNIGTTSLVGNILLDWEDHPEPDVTYNLYRSPYSVTNDGTYDYGYGEYIDSGLVTSDHADIQSVRNWRPGQMFHGVVYKYKITAVDDHGYESPRSVEVYGATRHPSNMPPTFNSTVDLANATAREAYSESLAGDASDPESDPLHFHIASGPDWLKVTQDGALSGMPDRSDEGTHQVTLQVTAIGGSMQKVVNITVDLPSDTPPGAPAAPTGLDSAVSDGIVSLSWDDSNLEADFYVYRIYRSVSPGNFGSLLATVASETVFVDNTVTNDTTYYYTVTAVDTSDNESSGTQTSATPFDSDPAPAAPTNLTATAGDYFVDLYWDANTEDDWVSYTIYRSGVSGYYYGDPIVTGLSTNSYRDNTVTNDATLFYVITATDANGNESLMSNEYSAMPSDIAPESLTGFLALARDGEVYLQWRPSIAVDFAGYNLYRSPTPGGSRTLVAENLTSTAYTDDSVDNGTTYYYVVTAVDASAQESASSDEQSATPQAGLLTTLFIGEGALDDPTQWDNGLPTGATLGIIGYEATVSMTAGVTYAGYGMNLLSDGLVTGVGINQAVLSGSVLTINGGTLNPPRGVNLKDGQILTLNSGLWDLRDAHITLTGSGTTINVNGGMINGSNKGISLDADTVMNINAGEIGSAESYLSYIGGNTSFNGRGGTVNFNGGTSYFSQLQGGWTGTSTMVYNISGAFGSIHAESIGRYPDRIQINWTPGTSMSMTIANYDSWAETEWEADRLTYNGQSQSDLNKTWDEVVAANGLGPGVRFNYDSNTKTLTLSDTNSEDSDGDGVPDFFEYLYGSDPLNAENDGFKIEVGMNNEQTRFNVTWALQEGFVLGEHYLIEGSIDLVYWGLLPPENYTMTETIEAGMKEVKLEFTQDYGPSFFIRLTQP